MHTKRINNSGRIVIPKEILEMFELHEGDLVDVTHNDRQIILEPHRQRYVCAVTGKVADEAIRIGEAWISKEGLKQIVKYMSDE
ncbi:AbrB/MazE/SpoVT family DNA-binding domain-containing protein (plasmid) [Planococcus maritimus]|uniref:AbrB/MazE/SpoVT family DNA-binding domain-containing protein n=1 Tax=Planococcus maritimus TaxID=192421 RepID=A0A7D7RPB6_PLAMR|nr:MULTISPECIES: AbrB/MazE/SpoVT family DNA-binding domain-containing protein [Planococcus]MDE0583253.1 AbrB/MazE/SpoVT family DNA-binding domain-containing protein [Planococcus sp. A6]QMT19144.1 AbrB/MazE/SpoVT family DNA-binding domain-containing protein [Planococcus maritimus]